MQIAIECQGDQHNRFIQHFHLNSKGFNGQLSRDQRKARFCKKNRIDLVYFKPEEKEEEWEKKIAEL